MPILAGGAVQCWGDDYGSGGRCTPVTESGVFGAIALSAGRSHTCAILAGGIIRCGVRQLWAVR